MDLHTDLSGPELAALFCAVVTGIAAFLPWVAPEVVAGPVDVEPSTTGVEGYGVVTLLLGVLVVALILLWGDATWAPMANALAGLLITIVAAGTLLDLRGPATPQLGLYLTLVGGFGILLSGLMVARLDATDSRGSPS